MQTQVTKQYLYQQFQDDLDLAAFVQSFNQAAQGYVDWANQINLPIYSGLSDKLLDWVGAGIYGLPRPIIGSPSGAVYDAFKYDQQNYGTGSVSSILASDDVYKRILTWKMFRGDGFYVSIPWLKRRVKRFILGRNGATPQIDNTYEISVKLQPNAGLLISINYPQDAASVALLVQYMNAGALDVPFQYPITAISV